MFKAWVCIIMVTAGAGSKESVSTSIIADIASERSCQRLGENARRMNSGTTYSCTQIWHTPE